MYITSETWHIHTSYTICQYIENPCRYPESQAEHIRRDYARKAFSIVTIKPHNVHNDEYMKALAWVNPGEYLWEYAPTKRSRLVITTDTIVNYVKAIHKLTDHLGGGLELGYVWEIVFMVFFELMWFSYLKDVLFVLKCLQNN